MQSAWLGSDMYQFLSHWFDASSIGTRDVQIPISPQKGDGRSTHLTILSGWVVVWWSVVGCGGVWWCVVPWWCGGVWWDVVCGVVCCVVVW